MKIAEIGCKKYPSREGGVDVVVQKLSDYFASGKNEVTVYVSRKNEDSPDTKGLTIIKVPTIHKKTTEAVLYSYFATQKARKGGFDVIHFHAEGNCLFLHQLKKCPSKIVVTIHGLDWKRGKFKGLGAKMLLRSEKEIVRYADEIITLSQGDHDYLKNKYRVDSTIIPNGFEEYSPFPPSIISAKFNLKKDGYFLYLARIVPEKGLHYLVQAFKNVESQLKGKKLVIAGAASYTNDYFNEIQSLAKSDENILFTGFVQGELLHELYSNAFYYVLPSDIEGMPLSLIEALGHQKTCIASDIPENQVDSGNILFFEHGNIRSLEETMVTAITRGNVFDESTIKIPTWNKVCESTFNLYQKEHKPQRF